MLKTARLRLRNFTPADADKIYEYRNTPECLRYQRYDDTSIEYIKDFVERFATSAFLSREKEQHYAIADLYTDELIGDLSLFYSESDACFTLGITLAGEHQRRGYAYEILDAVISRLEAKYPSLEIVALIDRENERSIALFKRLGFVLECYAESIDSLVFVK